MTPHTERNIISIDPGLRYTGIVGLHSHQGKWPPVLTRWGQLEHTEGDSLIDRLETILLASALSLQDAMIAEDYVIYSNTAEIHIGRRLLIPQLLGALEFAAYQEGTPFVCVRAAYKGRWPDARLRSKFPLYTKVPQPHALDALKLGLWYLEKEGHAVT